jgi:hypothetical protein
LWTVTWMGVLSNLDVEAHALNKQIYSTTFT